MAPEATFKTRPLTVADYAVQARHRLTENVWDFFAGGAGRELTTAANEAAFDGFQLRTRVLAGLDQPDLAVRVLERRWEAPIGVAPMAYHRLAHPEGEAGTARAAGRLGLPTVVSTFASQSLEDVAAAADGAPLWLQIYCLREWETTAALLRRAEAAGYEAMVLTVDTPRLGRRLRDLRNDFRIPDGITPVNLSATDGSTTADPAAHSRLAFEHPLSWDVIGRLRRLCSLPLIVKGVLTAEDAKAALAAGADAIVVSNHGGRQLDRVPASLAVLPEVVAVVDGRCPVFLDGGVRDGADVFIALALGATAVFIGRPVLYGLATAGSAGAGHVLSLLTEELAETMLFTGRATTADIDRTAVQYASASTAPGWHL
jgi:isopentenyl diphosphate isomerase/L-lactate dehydrogenase-like FMN-dependent dehydrogenase